MRLIDLLFESPVISPPEIMKRLKIPSRMTASRLVNELVRDDVLVLIDEKGPSGTKLYVFVGLIKIVN